MKKIILLFVVFITILFAFFNNSVFSNDDSKGRGLWVWKTSFENYIDGKISWQVLYNNTKQQDILVSFVEKKEIKNIYLYIGSLEWEYDSLFKNHKLYNEKGLSNLVEKLNKKGINVYGLYYLNDDPNNLSGIEKIKDLVQAVGDYNNRYSNAKIKGLQLDQEPYDTNKYGDYLNILKELKKYTKKYNLINQAALKPMWVNQKNDGELMIKKVFEYLDEGILMDYFDNLDTIYSLADRSFYGKLSLGIETGKRDVEDPNTFYQEIKTKGLSWFEKDILKKIENKYSNNNNFNGVSVHYYNRYFYFENGVEPYRYKKEIEQKENNIKKNLDKYGNKVISYPDEKWPTYKHSEFILEINPWNIKYPAKGIAEMYLNNNTITYKQDLSNLKIKNIGGSILAYPEILVGNKPWNGNYVNGGSNLPSKLDKLESLNLKANWNLSHNDNLACNFTMEGWFTKNKFELKGVKKGEVEMMIMWYKNNLNPAGTKVGSENISVVINGKKENITFDIYKQVKGWDFITFVPSNFKENKKIELEFNILKFTNVAKEYVPQIKDLYLENWEIGSEYGTPNTNKANIFWQIKDYKVLGILNKGNSIKINNNNKSKIIKKKSNQYIFESKYKKRIDKIFIKIKKRYINKGKIYYKHLLRIRILSKNKLVYLEKRGKKDSLIYLIVKYIHFKTKIKK